MKGRLSDAEAVVARLDSVRSRIRAAEERYGRNEGEVVLVAVSKKQDMAKIRAAFSAGQTLFGESYPQEGVAKIAALGERDAGWHFIGRIQSNKTQLIAGYFDWAHSLCSLKHAQRLSEFRLDEERDPPLPPLPVCIQVNVDDDPAKAGLAPAQVNDFIEACGQLAGIRIAGLMTLPARKTNEAAQREPFRALRLLRDRLATPSCPLGVLSMGMSADLEAAIAEGATMVRVGTAIFGPRGD